MLAKLDIQNFAIIKDLKVDFTTGFTALIGETGAGKSILIDALAILLGSRASTDFIRLVVKAVQLPVNLKSAKPPYR